MSDSVVDPHVNGTPRPRPTGDGDHPDSAVSLLDLNTEIDYRESARIILRSAAYIRYFFWRFTAKLVTTWIARAIPLIILPWPAKMLIDHVVLSRPIEDASGYPWFMWPVIEALYGSTPSEILLWLAAFGVTLVILIGAYPGMKDSVEAGLAQGEDLASQTENAMHGAHSNLGALYGYMEFKLNMRLTQALNHTLRSELYSRIMSLSMTRLEDQRIGDSIYRILYDTPQVNEIFYQIIHTPLMTITLFAVATHTMLSAYPESPEIVFAALAIIPTWAFAGSLFSQVVRRRGQAARAAGSTTTSTIEEGMDNVLAVQSLGGNEKEKGRFGKDSGESFRKHRAYGLIWMIIFQVSDFIGAVIQTFVFLYVCYLVIDGAMTPGDFGALFAFWYGLRGPAFELSWIWIRMQDNVAGMRRVFALMDLPPEADTGTTALPRISSGISMDGVGFVYPDGRRALRDVNIEANVGEIVAFVGPTGSGKTTLAYLIPRFHEASEGEVRIDGHNVEDLTIDSMRDQITYVFQETQLFSDSILDNISYGKPDATREEVERVARIAGVHDFISTLPDGYDTKLGTSNSKLSVGQKQRISIARGLLRESRILILDEPTSALDPETEEYLVQSLHEAAKDRLVIIIAHRLSTIAQADKIIFLEDGHVQEQGTHVQLMAREDGYYRAFVDLQTRVT